MAKPQQAELRRSGTVPALDPDATEAVLTAQDDTRVSRSRGVVPEEQQPGHHPDDEQDKPDLSAFAERLGIPAEGDEPDGAPHVEDGEDGLDEDSVVTTRPATEPSLPLAVKLVFLPPAVTFVGVRGVYRAVSRLVCDRKR